MYQFDRKNYYKLVAVLDEQEKDKVHTRSLYGQQDYSTPMLIHNTGKRDLIVGFQMYPYEWKIEVGTSKQTFSALKFRRKCK